MMPPSWVANGDTKSAGVFPDPTTQLVITLNDNGAVSVTGPIMDKLFCYGLLEGAKEVIAKYTPAKVG